MSIQQIHKDLKAGKIYPVYLLHGDESYLIDEAAALLESRVIDESAKSFDQQILYGNDHNAKSIIEQLLLFPLLSPRRLVIVREAQLMADIKELDAYVSKPAPTSVLVLCYKGKSLDKRLKLYDAVKKNGFILAADPLKDAQVVPWIMQTASELQFKLAPDAAEAMVELIGGEVSKLYPELKKLQGTHTAKDIVSRAEILDLVGMSREYNVFELQNALEEGDKLKMMKIAMIMAEQKDYSIIFLIATLAALFTRLYAVKSLSNADDASIGEAIGIKAPFAIRKIKMLAPRYHIQTLESILGWLHIYDMKAKGWNSTADDRALTIELLSYLMNPVSSPEFSDSPY